MRRTVPTAIVGSSTLLREGVTRILNSARFRVFASKPSVTELELEKFPQSEPWLLIMECGASAPSINRPGRYHQGKVSTRSCRLVGTSLGYV